MSATGPEPRFGAWRTSSYSNGGDNCVEISFTTGGRVGVRDSKNSAQPPQVYPTRTWGAFLAATTDGAFGRVTRTPSDAATTRRLLVSLAASPSQDAPVQWVGGLRAVIDGIRSQLAEADRHDIPTVAFATLLGWRTELDNQLAEMQQADPDRWADVRRPGTWLDSVLRLRSIVSHVVGKAYWDDRETVAYADIDVERYLWGAR